MDPPSRREALRASGFSGHSVQAYAPGAGSPRSSERYPELDAHLVKPEVTRDEVVRGRRVVALPSAPEHGDPHFRLDYVIAAHLKQGYTGSTDMITRFSERSDFATDTSIRRSGIDPATGKRYLEEVAFEVVHTQSLKDMRERAEDLTARGVRRMFAIFVKRQVVAEWASADGKFLDLAADASITDETLSAPFPVRALLNAAESDNGVAMALLAKNNPVLAANIQAQREKALQEGREEGIDKGIEKGVVAGQQNALLTILKARNLPISSAAQQAIRACNNLQTLERWVQKALTVKSAEELVLPKRKPRA
ncbi:MAG: hypothetical protein IPK82_10735 [Polyangiaceae bacterium]|nr:hypothetical protein [Polyangiaceae bacterium]